MVNIYISVILTEVSHSDTILLISREDKTWQMKGGQVAKKVIFTACHSGKLKLKFTSTNVISTSPLINRLDFIVQPDITETTSNLQTPKETPSSASPKITENSKGTFGFSFSTANSQSSSSTYSDTAKFYHLAKVWKWRELIMKRVLATARAWYSCLALILRKFPKSLP